MISRRTIIPLLTLTVVGIAAFCMVALKQRVAATNCVATMSAICFAGKMWSNAHDGRFPPDFLSMSNELVTPRVLFCPGDRARERPTQWSSFASADSSYRIMMPGVLAGDTNSVFLFCTVHGHKGYADTTVFDGTQRRHKHPTGGVGNP